MVQVMGNMNSYNSFLYFKKKGYLCCVIMTNDMTNSVKRQTRKVGVAGGFINQMMGNNSTTPVVGEGATILMYSDRDAYEVISVSDNGNQCVIRAMETTFVGACYGDERYTYKSNKNGETKTLEWNAKKGCWGEVTYTIEIIRALAKRLEKEYGWDWVDHLPVDINDIIIEDETNPFVRYKLVPGVTKEYKNFYKVSVIFGVMEQYRDPSF